MPKKSYTHIFIDISNSWTKYAFGTPKNLASRLSLPTREVNAAFVKKLRQQEPSAILVISSVVPEKNSVFKKNWPLSKIHFLTNKSPLGIKIIYPKPQKIGADRLANAAAAAKICKCPAIVVDFGTAVTFDVLSADRAYIGGVIAPGLNAMTDYLYQQTALLPKLTLQEPKRIVGKNTIEAMRVGAVIGYRGLVKEIIHQLKKELQTDTIEVIATGGHSELISRKVPEIKSVHPLLTLQGLQIIAANL
jgi:type III pantothenate kinase